MRLILTILCKLEQDGKRKQEGFIFTSDIYEQVYGFIDAVPKAVIIATHKTIKRLISRDLIKETIRPLSQGQYLPAFILTDSGETEAKALLS